MSTCRAPARPKTGASVKLVQVTPTDLLVAPIIAVRAPGDDETWYFGDSSTNRILRWTPGSATTEVFADISHLGYFVGFTFHPDYASNGQVFFQYTYLEPGVAHRVVVSRFRRSEGSNVIDTTSAGAEEVLIRIGQPHPFHNGGKLAFGPDGFLYAGFGDGGEDTVPSTRPQDPFSFNGKLVRLDVNVADPVRGTPYSIPADNPFASGEHGLPEIYALGLRNPWQWSFDRATGELWLGDVGAQTWEEINIIQKGGNYGWPLREGPECMQAGCEAPELIAPVYAYGRTAETAGAGGMVGLSVTGGYVYRGSRIPSLVGVYVFGDFMSGAMGALFHGPDGQLAPRVLLETGLRIVTFTEDHAGELYLLDHQGGDFYRLEPEEQLPTGDDFPQLLSETGCVEPTEPKKPAAGLVAYDVNVPLWSDGAEKQRFLSLPRGERIKVKEDGAWEYPPGTVFMKTFQMGERMVETRLLILHEDGEWGGYSYAWNEEQTDATLLPAGEVRHLGEGATWTFPSRSQCMTCHTKEAGRVLGFEVSQLNRTVPLVASSGIHTHQLMKFNELGLFEPTLGESVRVGAALPSMQGPAPLEARARAYLHANCAGCHRGVVGRAHFDLRFQVPFAEQGLCDAPPKVGSLGIEEARLFSPGAPQRSLLWVRMASTELHRMPPLGTAIVDEEAVALVRDWIEQTGSCP